MDQYPGDSTLSCPTFSLTGMALCITSMNNQLLNALNVNDSDNVVFIKEHDSADSNFILTNLMKQILNEKKTKICLLILHNTIGHYANVGKKLGYDLMARVRAGDVSTIEPMTDIFNELAVGSSDSAYLKRDRNEIVTRLLREILETISELRKSADVQRIYLIIDDLSHLNDLGISYQSIMKFVNVFTHNLCPSVNIIVNMHIADENDSKISNAMEYLSDVSIDVAPLSTGRSNDVTGVITINRIKDDSQSTYHYKAMDKDIRMFKPGESIYYLSR